MTRPLKPPSIAAQALGWEDATTRAIAPPIHTSTTFIRDPDNQFRSGRIYARDHNPTFDQAEAVLTALEGGHASLLFASGMAAATAVFQALAPGDHVLVPKVMYWSLRNWLLNFATHWGLQVDVIGMADPDELRGALQPGRTKLVWIETPANPLWTITDVALTCEIAHAAGAMVAVDSTVATPVLTRPLALGADIVMHSATKYLNGHSDVIAGTLTTRADSDLWQRIKLIRAQVGGILGPFEAWLLMRGMRTLFPRVQAACAGAAVIAAALRTARPGQGSAVSGVAIVPGSRSRVPTDARRFRRHDVHPRAGRRSGRHRHRGKRGVMEARDFPWRRGKPARAPRECRRCGHAGTDRSAAPLGRDRGPG